MDRKAVSPDSSTQLTEKGKRAKKTKHKHRGKKKKSKRFKSSSSVRDIESDVGTKTNKTNTDDVTPLIELVNNREELYIQLFSIIPKKEVHQIMPEILKKISLKEVKRLCFQQLEQLSNKKLQSIMLGCEMSSSDEEDPTDLENPPCNIDGLQKVQVVDKDKNTKDGKEEKKKDIRIFQEMITIPNQQEIDELLGENSTSREGGSSEEGKFIKGTSQSSTSNIDEEAELKELEFRARALESLVRAREQQMSSEQALGTPF